MHPSRRSPRPPLCRRRLRIVGLRYRDCARWQVTLSPSRPGQRHRLRGWLSRTTGEAYGAPACAPVASPCFPGLHTTHIVRSFPRASVTTLFRTAPTLLTREPLRRWNKDTHNMALCDAPLLHCHADCFPDSPSGTRLPSSRGNQRASLQASFAPTQPLRRKGTAGSAFPMLAGAARTPTQPRC